MPRIPYERIVTEADKLFQKVTMARDIKTMRYWYDAYVAFLKAAGWDPVSFDQEMQRRVDADWFDEKPIDWN